MIKKQRDKNENQYHLWGSGRLVLFSALLTFCTFLAFVWLLLIPSDLDSGILLGFSSSRLAALLILLAAFSIFLIASIGFYRKPQLEKKVLPFFQKPKVLMAGFITALTLFLLTWSFLFFFHFLDEHFNPFIKTASAADHVLAGCQQPDHDGRIHPYCRRSIAWKETKEAMDAGLDCAGLDRRSPGFGVFNQSGFFANYHDPNGQRSGRAACWNGRFYILLA